MATFIYRNNGITRIVSLLGLLRLIVTAAYRIVRTYLGGNHGRSVTVEFAEYPVDGRMHFQETRVTVWCRAIRNQGLKEAA